MMLFLQLFKQHHYDYDHISYTDFAPSSKCSACKCQDCKAKHDGVINTINALTASVKELTSKRGFILSKRISYPYTPLEIKMDVTIEATAKHYNITVNNPSTSSKEKEKWSLNYNLFATSYVEYLSDGLQVPNDGLDAGLLRKIYDALLWKYGKVKAQKAYASDIKDPRRPNSDSIAPDKEQLVHIE
ncbi:hypothetical protein BC332_28440 [Capsicum chinense]|nr:hypothetical protein BC332_28440 [Capsicum chinense]